MNTHDWFQMSRSLRVTGMTLVAVLMAAGPALAVTVTDCANDPNIVVHGGTDTTRIEVAPDDLIIECALAPLGGTDKIVLEAANITIQGPTGRVSANGTGTAIRITVSDTFTALDTAIESSNGNSSVDIVTGGDILFGGTNVTVGSAGSGGDQLLITCTGAAPDCTITAVGSTFKSRELDMVAIGDIMLAGVTITTNSPRDRVEIISLNGNVDAGINATAPQQPPGNKCGGGGTGPVTTPNVILGGPESDLLIQAFGFVDLSGSRITVAQNVFVMSGVGGGAASVPAFIDIAAAAIRNDIGKRGEIEMTADETIETILAAAVLLIDDDDSASVNDVSELNGCEVVPRGPCPNVVGTPSTDS